MRHIILGLCAVACFVSSVGAPATAQAPQPQPGPPETLSAWSKGARLYDGLGTFHRKITTRSPLAQRYFDQGMRFVWAFNHDEATRSFAKAAQLDPSCASCFWGVALTLGPNYNMPMMNLARARLGWHAVQKARADAAHATPVERALIAAVSKRYSAGAEVNPSNSSPILGAYAGAMRNVAAEYPNDLDVQTMYAEALMNKAPWRLWNGDGTPAGGTTEIVSILRGVIVRNPQHPGANHYYVHAIEASKHPEEALHSALALKAMMPAAGHLDHMPKTTAPPDYYPMYLIHNFQFLASSAGMEGRRAETIQALRTARQNMPDAMLLAMPGFDWSAGFLYDGYVKFGMWDEMLAEPAPNPKLTGATISYLQARATALAAKGRVPDSAAMLATSRKLIDAVPADATQGNNNARQLYEIGQLKARARFASAQGQHDQAIANLTQAAAAEDKLSYNEPSDMIYPVRPLLGAELLAANRPGEAEAAFRDDLKLHPNNGWSLYGLSRALAAEKRNAEAAAATQQFEKSWSNADIRLTPVAF